MNKRSGGKNRQKELFRRSLEPKAIPIDESHHLVQICDELDWDELEELAQNIRMSKLTSAAGRPPHLRQLLGAVAFRSTRKMTYRESEDLIRHYGPARYLCALTETDWSPDANTIQDFEELMGSDGMASLNEYVVNKAVLEKLADPMVAAADTTAQEAAIPYPNEIGLLTSFLSAVTAGCKKAGKILKDFLGKAHVQLQRSKKKIREYRLFAKDKSKQAKDRMTAEVVQLVEGIQKGLESALEKSRARSSEQLVKYGKVAQAKLIRLNETMKKLLPQIRHWLRTGRVAADKIISLQIPELYSIVRGKVGKAVEFGLTWGITRLKGGFLIATLSLKKGELHDSKFAVRAVRDLKAMFGKAPHAYAYDRAGYSEDNIRDVKEAGVKELALAPRGKQKWLVRGRRKEMMISERAQIEGGIGAIKSQKYGFNRPAARSAEMMGVCGHRAVLGYNLCKLMRELSKRRNEVMVG